MLLHFFTVLILGSVGVHGKVACIGENGEPVDMFIIYKLPRITSAPGNNYVYLDSTDLQFRHGKEKINNTLNAAAKTLNQVYEQYRDEFYRSKTLAHIFYNDAPPYEKGYNFTFGHTKGELAFDKDSGFWIIQSVPRFPTRADIGYEYPSTGFKYGQMMMCVSFLSESFKDIGLQLKYMRPHIYDGNLPGGWEHDYKDIFDVLEGSFINHQPFARTVHLKSAKGIPYWHFAKTGEWHKDLYYHLVAPTLNTNLIAETWQHGKHNLGPSCKGNHTVVDISLVSISASGKLYNFRTYDDHSKYALAEDGKAPFVCVGDINRQFSQFYRGGGCICLENIGLWKTFSSLVSKAARCPSSIEMA